MAAGNTPASLLSNTPMAQYSSLCSGYVETLQLFLMDLLQYRYNSHRTGSLHLGVDHQQWTGLDNGHGVLELEKKEAEIPRQLLSHVSKCPSILWDHQPSTALAQNLQTLGSRYFI